MPFFNKHTRCFVEFPDKKFIFQPPKCRLVIRSYIFMVPGKYKAVHFQHKTIWNHTRSCVSNKTRLNFRCKSRRAAVVRARRCAFFNLGAAWTYWQRAVQKKSAKGRFLYTKKRKFKIYPVFYNFWMFFTIYFYGLAKKCFFTFSRFLQISGFAVFLQFFYNRKKIDSLRLRVCVPDIRVHIG